MKAIVAVDKNWGIGKKNGLLFRLSKDMAFFREKTVGKVVVMGSNTLKSFPGGNPLKNRTNIVLFPGGEKRGDCIVADSMEELSSVLKNHDTDDVFVIGGAMFYRTMLPYCDTVYVTKADADGGAEVFFENLDNLKNWRCADEGEPIEDNGYIIRFTTYKNDTPLKF
jgi:dihydrofolate reductase